MKEKRFTLRALILTAVSTLALTLGGVALTAWLRLGPGGLAVLRSYTAIRDRFIGSYDPDLLADSAIHGMVFSLGDRWSVYLSPQDYSDWEQRMENAYIGIGITYQPDEGRAAMVILSVTEDSPAYRAGLRAGERITAIDGRPLTPDSFDEQVAAIAENVGRDITFTVVDDSGNTREVVVRPARVDTRPVTWELRPDGIGYIRLKNFYNNTAQRAIDAVDQMVDQGAKALLFDVRANPGGYVNEMTDLLDRLLDAGPIHTERSRHSVMRVTYSGPDKVDLPIAVLIDANSYSAAEMFAAQLRESAGAVLIGEKTYGKGYYQQNIPLPNGGALHLSTGLYTTGNGTSLIGTGLTPDVVESDPDRQLEKAIEQLKEKME